MWDFAAGAEITASPAVGMGGLVIGTSDGGIYCFGEKKDDKSRK
ncbi:PQQ-binding-like beta-propeller repeat protein [Planctomycetota bacterium]